MVGEHQIRPHGLKLSLVYVYSLKLSLVSLFASLLRLCYCILRYLHYRPFAFLRKVFCVIAHNASKM